MLFPQVFGGFKARGSAAKGALVPHPAHAPPRLTFARNVAFCGREAYQVFGRKRSGSRAERVRGTPRPSSGRAAGRSRPLRVTGRHAPRGRAPAGHALGQVRSGL